MPSNFKNCPQCGYPQHGDKEEKLSYNLHLIELKSWRKSRKNSLHVFPLLGSCYFLLFCVLLFIQFGFNGQELNFYIFSSLLLTLSYVLLFLLGRKLPIIGFTLGSTFYLVHTTIEYFTRFNPEYWLMEPISDYGFFNFAPFLPFVIEILPYIYFVIRILLIVIFVRGLYYSIRIWMATRQLPFKDYF